MLKFEDLSVDVKSFENTLNSYMKLFPNSYMPLLIMYLSREGLLREEIELDEEYEDGDGLDENEFNILLTVTQEELADFFKSSLSKESNHDDMVEIYSKVLGVDIKENGFFNNFDLEIFLSMGELVRDSIQSPSVHVKSYSLVYNKGDETVDRIKNILIDSNTQIEDKAALWLFWKIFSHKAPEKSANDEEWVFGDSAKCFETTLQRISAYSGRQEFIQPMELTRIILSQYSGGSVYNPFAGLASYHIAMSYGSSDGDYISSDTPHPACHSLGDSYYGEEINELAWALGKLRLLFYGMDSSNYILADSTKKFEGKIDNIFSTPPFNFEITNEAGEKEYADHFVLRRGIDMLTEDGMLSIVVPVSFFNRKDTYDIRKELVTKHLLTDVVFLPENIFLSSRVSTAIIFVRKNNEREDVKFVDGTKSYSRGRDNINTLDCTAIAHLIKYSGDPMADFWAGHDIINISDDTAPYVSFERYENIVANDYNLSPSNYFSSFIDVPEGFKLEEFGTLVSAKETTKVLIETEGKVITINNLSKDYQLPYIDSTTLESKVVNSNYKLLDRKSLLVSSLNELKPSLYIPKEDETLYLSPNVMAFFLNEKKIVPEYLIGELSKGYVKEQLRIKVMGTTIHRIKRSDILSLRILVPNVKDFLKREKSIVEEQKAAFLEKIGVELAELKDNRHDEFVRMLRQRKHRIQQVMNEFGPAFALLDKCRLKNGGVLKDSDIVASRTGETVDSYFAKLNKIVSKVEDLVTNLVDKVHWGPSTIVNIDAFVDNIPQLHLSDKYDIQTHHQHDVEIYEEGETADLNEDRFININEEDLAILFDNIIANAAKWGFTDLVRRDYRILIDVSDAVLGSQTAVRICVSNNGEPIHPSVDRKRFFEWGYGSGTGIGTWQLKDIVEHYGGTIKLNEYPDEISGFQTEYEIIIPLADNY